MTPAAARIAADTIEALPPLAPETPAEHLARVIREGPDELRQGDRVMAEPTAKVKGCPLIAAAARILAVATGATTPPRAEDLARIAEEVSAMRVLVARARKPTERSTP